MPLLSDPGTDSDSADQAADDQAAEAAAAERAASASSGAGAGATQYLPPAFLPREGETQQLREEVVRVRAKISAHNEAVAAGQLPPAVAAAMELMTASQVVLIEV